MQACQLYRVIKPRLSELLCHCVNNVYRCISPKRTRGTLVWKMVFSGEVKTSGSNSQSSMIVKIICLHLYLLLSHFRPAKCLTLRISASPEGWQMFLKATSWTPPVWLCLWSSPSSSCWAPSATAWCSPCCWGADRLRTTRPTCLYSTWAWPTSSSSFSAFLSKPPSTLWKAGCLAPSCVKWSTSSSTSPCTPAASRSLLFLLTGNY